VPAGGFSLRGSESTEINVSQHNITVGQKVYFEIPSIRGCRKLKMDYFLKDFVYLLTWCAIFSWPHVRAVFIPRTRRLNSIPFCRDSCNK